MRDEHGRLFPDGGIDARKYAAIVHALARTRACLSRGR
jgi:hypothetical protein